MMRNSIFKKKVKCGIRFFKKDLKKKNGETSVSSVNLNVEA